MRPCAPIAKWLWICLLALSIPWTGPTINPHLLEHEAENNRVREALPPHVHEGVHFEAAWEPHDSPGCLACLRSLAKGMANGTAPTEGQPDAPLFIERPDHEHMAAFRLAGRVAARAPPRFLLHSI